MLGGAGTVNRGFMSRRYRPSSWPSASSWVQRTWRSESSDASAADNASRHPAYLTMGLGLLALTAGVGHLFLPATLGILAPTDANRTDVIDMTRYAVHMSATLVVFYLGLAAFTAASLIYRWRRIRCAPAAMVIPRADVVNGKATPPLAARVNRGWPPRSSFGPR